MRTRIISFLLLFVICISLTGNVFADYDWSDWTDAELLELMTSLMEEVEERTGSGTSKSSSSYNSYSSSSELSEKEIEEKALSALYDELSSGKMKTGVKYTSYYDIDATKYNVGTIEKNKNDAWEVNGTIYLYNKYGEYKASGTFTSTVSKNGRTASCYVKIK